MVSVMAQTGKVYAMKWRCHRVQRAEFREGDKPQTQKQEPNGVYMTPSQMHKAIQHYMGFDLFAEVLGHELGDVEPQPLFDTFKAAFG